jgi:hypothetical protein
MAGFNAAIDRYREFLAAVGRGRLILPNDNIDVGTITAAGKYRLTDATYAKLLRKLEGHYVDLPQEIRSDILAFYQDLSQPISTKTNQGDWAKLQGEVAYLAAVDRDLGTADKGKVSVALVEPTRK